ncbi:MAG TPA: NADH-quinone oxidoreductase subunit C [Thermoplasmata archaeon]|nr:NADH-quinone oxidoreductase subunit C [Thermoplasmata archaeon]
MRPIKAEELLELMTKEFGDRITDSKITKRVEGKQKRENLHLSVTVDRESFKDVVRWLADVQYPLLSVISGWDAGDRVELLYEFQLNGGVLGKGLALTLRVGLPKDSLKIETICDIIPGAQIGEREKQEMLGVRVEGTPDPRRFFLPDDFPEGVYPWRKDESGVPESMIKKLWEAK